MNTENKFYLQAETYINPLLERGNKIETIEENVKAIRGWVVKTRGKRLAANPSITKHQRTVTRKNNGNEVKYIIEATDENDADSVDALGFAVLLVVQLNPEKENDSKSLQISFQYDPEDPDIKELDPSNNLFCEIYAQDDIGDQTYPGNLKQVNDLLPEELEAVFGISETVRDFIK